MPVLFQWYNMPKTPVPGSANLQHVSEIMARHDMIHSLKKVFFPECKGRIRSLCNTLNEHILGHFGDIANVTAFSGNKRKVKLISLASELV